MAESVTIEPKIITDGACPTKFLIVDPNPSYANVRQEDLNIYAKLVAKTKSKSIITSNNEINTVDTLDLRSIDLLTPQKKVKFQSKEGSGEIGKSVNREFLSTDWTEIGRGLLTDSKLGSDYEGFGITGIDIKIEASLTPRVNIDFVDIRGATLFEQGSCSPYGLFFHLPYPTFELTVKGFYGKPVKWYLNLIKFNTKFNSETGNFESKAEFIGYSYAFLADMLMGYIMAGPYMKDYDANGKLEKIYKNIETYYGGFKNLDACPDEGCITIVSLLDKLQSLGGALGEIKAASEYEKLQNLIKIKDKLRELLELSSKYLSEQDEKEKLKRVKSDNEKSGKIKVISDKKIQEKSPLGELNKRYWDSTVANLGLIPTKAQYIKKMDYDGDNSAGTIVKVFTTDVDGNKPLNELKFQQGFLTPQSYIKMRTTSGDPFFIDLGIFNQGIISDLEIIRKKVEDLRKIINEAVDIVVIEALGFKPTIRNVFIILTANVELFIEILMEVTRRAEVYHNEKGEAGEYKNNNTNYFDGTQVLSSGVEKEKRYKTVWPWPTYYVKEDDATVEKYPGTNDNFLGWEEVKFVEQFLTALLNMNKDIEQFGDKRAGIAGRDNYVPINPLESPINDRFIELKYKEAGEDSDNAVYKTIGERMFVSLDHSYYQPIHLNENGVISSSGPIRKGENWNPLVGKSREDLVRALGMLDAQNLLNTLEDVSMILTINNKITGDELLNAVKTQLGITSVKVTSKDIGNDFIYYNNGIPKILESIPETTAPAGGGPGNNASGTFLDMPWTNVNPLDTSFLGITKKKGQIIPLKFNLSTSPTIIGASQNVSALIKHWKYIPIDGNGDPTEGIILNGTRQSSPKITIKPNPLKMDSKDLFKIIEYDVANNAPKIGLYGSDDRVKEMETNIAGFNKRFSGSVTKTVLGDGFEKSNLAKFNVDNNTKCLTFDSDALFIRLRPDIKSGLDSLTNKHFLTPNYWGNDDNNHSIGTMVDGPFYITQTKPGTSSFFLLAAMFEWGPIIEKLQESNFDDGDEYDKYIIKQTFAPGLFNHATGLPDSGTTNYISGSGTLTNQGNVKGAHPKREDVETPFVFNTLVQTPLWLDNCNNFRAGINSSTLGYAGYGGVLKDAKDYFGQNVNKGTLSKLDSIVCNAKAGGCTSKEVQDRNLAYLFLHSFKPTPFSVNSISEFDGGTSCNKPRGCGNINGIWKDDKDNDVWTSIPEPFARIPFANAASMIKVPKLWVYAVGATFWRYRSWRGSTNNGEKWNKGTETYKTGFDPLAQPGYPTRDNFYQVNSTNTVTIVGITKPTAVESILGDTGAGPSYLGYNADLYGGDNSVNLSTFSDLFNYADSNIRTKAYYKYVLGYSGGTDYVGINSSAGPSMGQYVQASSFMDTIHQGLINGQQTYSAGFGAYFDYYGLYSRTTQDNNQFKDLFVPRSNGLVFSEKKGNIYALVEADSTANSMNNSDTPWYTGWGTTKQDINGIPTTTDFRFSSAGSDIYGSNPTPTIIPNSGRVMRDTWWDIKYIAPWDFGYFTPAGFDDDKWVLGIDNLIDDSEYNGLYATLPQVGSSMTYQSMSPAQPHYYYMANKDDGDGGTDYEDIKVIDSPYHNGNEGRIIYESLPDVVKNMFIEKFEEWVEKDFAINILPVIDPCNFGKTDFIKNYKLTKLEKIKVEGAGVFQTSGEGDHPRLNSDYVLTLDEQILNLREGLLDDHFLILNSTPKIWWGHDKFPDYFLIDELSVTQYLDSFSDVFTKQYTDRINELEEDNESEEVLGESATDDDDIKLSIYRSMKSISDKWLSIGTDGKLFFNITDDDCGRIKENDDKESSRPLAAHFSFVNRLMGDIGDKAVIDITKLNKLQDNKRESFYQLIVDLLAENKFDFFPLPSFFNFTKSGQLFEDDSISVDEREKKQVEHEERLKEDLKDMFKPITSWDCVSGGPQFISMFVGGTSRALDLPPSANCPIDYNDLDSLKNDSFGLSKIGEKCPDNGRGGVSAFRVAYGIENQSHFKSIQLDQAEFSETNESLQVIDKLANAGDPSNRALKGQNIHNVYLTRSYNCTVEAMGNMMISPLMYFELTNVPMFHGTYIIKEVSHKVSPHSVVTTFMGTRQPIATVPIVTEVASALNIAISNAKITENGRTIDEIRSQGTGGGSSQSGGGGGIDNSICNNPWKITYNHNSSTVFPGETDGNLPTNEGVCQVMVNENRSSGGNNFWVLWEYHDALEALDESFKNTFGFYAPPTGTGYRTTLNQIKARIRNNCPTCGDFKSNRESNKGNTNSTCYKNGYKIYEGGNGVGTLDKDQLKRSSSSCRGTDVAPVHWGTTNNKFFSGSNHGKGAAIDMRPPKKMGGGRAFYGNLSGIDINQNGGCGNNKNDNACGGLIVARKSAYDGGVLKSDGYIDITEVKKRWRSDGSGVGKTKLDKAIYYLWLRKNAPLFGIQMLSIEAWHFDYIVGPPGNEIYGWHKPKNGNGTGIGAEIKIKKTFRPSGNYTNGQEIYLNNTTGRPCADPNQPCNDFPTTITGVDLFDTTPANTGNIVYGIGNNGNLDAGGHIYTVPITPKSGFEELLIIWPGGLQQTYDEKIEKCCQGAWLHTELETRNKPTTENYHILYMAKFNSNLDDAILTVGLKVGFSGGGGKKPSEFDKSKTSLAGFSGGGAGLFSNYDKDYKKVVFMDASVTKKKSDWPTFNNNVVWEYILGGAMYNAFKAGGLYNKDSKKKCDTNCYDEMNTVITTAGGTVEKTDNKTLKDLLDPATVGRSVCGTHCNVPTYMVSKWFS